MREICTSGSEGGGVRNQSAPPTPISNRRRSFFTTKRSYGQAVSINQSISNFTFLLTGQGESDSDSA
jgi:hypothetical protein